MFGRMSDGEQRSAYASLARACRLDDAARVLELSAVVD